MGTVTVVVVLAVVVGLVVFGIAVRRRRAPVDGAALVRRARGRRGRARGVAGGTAVGGIWPYGGGDHGGGGDYGGGDGGAGGGAGGGDGGGGGD